MASGAKGDEYVQKLGAALRKLDGDFKLEFVVAGTDVLATDPLGRLGLIIDGCAERERLVEARRGALSVPA